MPLAYFRLSVVSSKKLAETLPKGKIIVKVENKIIGAGWTLGNGDLPTSFWYLILIIGLLFQAIGIILRIL